MAKKQLFSGVVECLQKGGMTISDMSDHIGRPVQHVEREIDRIKQLSGFKHWIVYKEGSMTYQFTKSISDCPLNSIIYMIKHFYRLEKSSMDMKMDLVGKSKMKKHRSNVSSDDYGMLDKLLKLANYDVNDYQDLNVRQKPKYARDFDFSCIAV